MGVGNYYLENAYTVYVDHEEVYGEWDPETGEFERILCDCDYGFLFRDFINTIRNLLPAWFNACEGYRPDGRGLIIAQSQFYQVSVVDWEGYFAVNVELMEKSPFEDDPDELAFFQKARELHQIRSEEVFDAMSELFGLRIRTSAWTSGTYQSTKANAA